MRLAFMGSPDFAVPALRALHAAGHEIAAVLCQRPKPAGRGHALRFCPVQVEAERLGLAIHTPARLRDPAVHAWFAALGLDAAVVAAYGLLLPQAMLEAPHRGCLNIHASLLPRWRGAAPIQAAILGRDTETGVTIIQMDAGLDTGPMLLREAVPIAASATAAELHDKLADIGARLVLRALAENPPPLPQPADGVTYAPKLTRESGRIDWTHDAMAIERQVRAFDPWPGTFTMLEDAVLKVLAAEPVVGSWGPPGAVLDDKLTVACGAGALRLLRVQLAGRSAMAAETFLRGHRLPAGTLLGSWLVKGTR
jgi:methionyl-tRNA formyltransferase